MSPSIFAFFFFFCVFGHCVTQALTPPTNLHTTLGDFQGPLGERFLTITGDNTQDLTGVTRPFSCILKTRITSLPTSCNTTAIELVYAPSQQLQALLSPAFRVFVSQIPRGCSYVFELGVSCQPVAGQPRVEIYSPATEEVWVP